MGEVRACVYFSVIFLFIQISAAKPFFDSWIWCDFWCEDDDGSTTTASSEDYMDDFCNSCPTRRPRPVTTQMPPALPNSATPLPPGVPGALGPPGPPGFNQPPGMGPGPVNYFMMNPAQNGGGMAFSMGPDPNRNGWYNFVWNPPGGPGNISTPPPNATPAPVTPPTSAAAAPAASAAPAAAATTAAPAVSTAAPAAPAAGK